jgi:hypothetical protein
MLAVLGPLAAVIGGPIRVEAADVAKIDAIPGTIVRWSVPGTKRCGMGSRSWDALQETCYYPIDVLQEPAVLSVSRKGAKGTAHAQIVVLAMARESVDITLPDIPQAHPSPTDLKRNARDQAVVAKLWTRREGPAQFTLPLAPPASPLPEGTGFGSMWIFDNKPESADLHSGTDYPLTGGSRVMAPADGTVALAENLFFAGNAVFIDHGNGLISMCFHLDELKVQTGQNVRKGDALGLVGSTGRATGPHLHLGVRWHGARIDPQLLLDDPASIPAIGP